MTQPTRIRFCKETVSHFPGKSPFRAYFLVLHHINKHGGPFSTMRKKDKVSNLKISQCEKLRTQKIDMAHLI